MCVHTPLRRYCETFTRAGLTYLRSKPAPMLDQRIIARLHLHTPEPADDHSARNGARRSLVTYSTCDVDS